MPEKKGNLLEVVTVFFKLGLTAFGGPAAHIAMMEAEIVTKRKWMDKQHFLDLIGATNLIPGPNSTEMTMHCGHERAGKAGLFLGGLAFIFPAVVITGLLAWIYTEYGKLPQIENWFYGIKPAVIAIIAFAAYSLGKKAFKNYELMILGALVLAACLLGVGEIIALFGAGFLGMFYFSAKSKMATPTKSFLPLLLVQSVSVASAQLATLKIFWIFLKIGAILYGGGYVLFAYLDAELVETGWMTRNQLLDAVAVGQFTPGPVLSTATFVGWQLGGFWGSLAATAGIFLPSFLFVLLLNPLIPKMRKSKMMGYFLDAVNAASIAIIVAVVVTMSIDVLIDWRSIAIALCSTAILFSFPKTNAIWFVIGGSVLGYLLLMIG
jgi:chromate transporter